MDVTFFDLDVEDRPGVLGQVAAWLEAGGVNIEAFSAGRDGLRLCTNDPDRTRTLLAENKVGFKEEPVIEIRLENKPGQLAKIGNALGKHGVNIISSFGAAGGTERASGSIYIGVDSVDAAWEAMDGID